MPEIRATNASRTTRAVVMESKKDRQEVEARKRAEEEQRRRSVRLWTAGGHVFDGQVAGEQVERHLRDGLLRAAEPGATIDLHTGDTVVAVVAAHVVAVRFVRARET